jgi:rare lipoprotein A
MLRVIATAVFSIWIGGYASSAVAQDFNDRWSIIPKAHAEPAPSPAPEQTKENAAEEYEVRNQRMRAPDDRIDRNSSKRVFSGKASFYSYSKRKTANGSLFNRDALTAAHRNLPFGTRIRVTDLASSKSVIVRITDRGPWIRGRIVDLSLGAARSLGITDRGVATVRVEVL